MSTLLAPSASQPDRTDADYPRPAIVGGALAGAAVAVAGAIVCTALAVIGWLGTDGGSAPGAARIGLNAWSLAHGGPVEFGGARLSLLPLGLTAVALLALVGAGRWLVRTSAVSRVRDAAAGTIGLGLSYGSCAVLLALIGRSDAGGADLVRAGVGAAIVAVVGGSAGVFADSGVASRGWRRLPREVRAVCVGGVAGVLALLTAAAMLLGGVLIAQFDRVVGLTQALAPGVVGGVLLTLISVVYVPTAIVYAAAFVVGPGFSVGVDTIVSPTGVDLGPLPSLPLLAALPAATPGAWVMALLAIPFVAGIVAGVLAVRAYPPGTHDLAALRGTLAGVVGGALVGALAFVSSGSAGPGRLATVGPPFAEVGGMAMLTMALGGAVAALAITGWRTWRTHRAVRQTEPDPGPPGESGKAAQPDGPDGAGERPTESSSEPEQQQA